MAAIRASNRPSFAAIARVNRKTPTAISEMSTKSEISLRTERNVSSVQWRHAPEVRGLPQLGQDGGLATTRPHIETLIFSPTEFEPFIQGGCRTGINGCVAAEPSSRPNPIIRVTKANWVNVEHGEPRRSGTASTPLKRFLRKYWSMRIRRSLPFLPRHGRFEIGDFGIDSGIYLSVGI